MLIKLKFSDESLEIEYAEPIPFAKVPIRPSTNAIETDLEQFIADNVEILESPIDSDGSLLVISRQATTNTRRRLDLVAIDSTGALTLIEVKRDAVDVASRKENAEIQAVRYAASLAKLQSVDLIVQELYEHYVAKHCEAELRDHGGDRSPSEWARKKLLDFIDENDIDINRLNHKQKIVLVGASFDDDTKSAAAWMASNGLPIRMVELETLAVGENYYINVQQIVPLQVYEDFYVDLKSTTSSCVPKSISSRSQNHPKAKRILIQNLIESGLISVGDNIWVKNHESSPAVLTNHRECEFRGITRSINQWAKEVTGWSAVNIYDRVVHGPSIQLLEEIRNQCEADMRLGENNSNETGGM